MPAVATGHYTRCGNRLLRVPWCRFRIPHARRGAVLCAEPFFATAAHGTYGSWHLRGAPAAQVTMAAQLQKGRCHKNIYAPGDIVGPDSVHKAWWESSKRLQSDVVRDTTYVCRCGAPCYHGRADADTPPTPPLPTVPTRGRCPPTTTHLAPDPPPGNHRHATRPRPIPAAVHTVRDPAQVQVRRWQVVAAVHVHGHSACYNRRVYLPSVLVKSPNKTESRLTRAPWYYARVCLNPGAGTGI